MNANRATSTAKVAQCSSVFTTVLTAYLTSFNWKRFGLCLHRLCGFLTFKHDKTAHIIIDKKKQMKNVKYFNYLGGMMPNDAKCTRDIKCRIAIAKQH